MDNEVSMPGFNWFVHSLVNDVAYVEWIKMTPSEQEEANQRTGSDYPYKTVEHPIPNGKTIKLEKGKVKIKCNTQEVRDYIIKLAMEYNALERKYVRLLEEKRSDRWHHISELPPHPPCSSFHERGRTFLVDSSVLHYVEGVTFGFRDGDKWYIYVNNVPVEHPVTHYRHIPPHAGVYGPYEDVKEEVEKLRKLFEKS